MDFKKVFLSTTVHGRGAGVTVHVVHLSAKTIWQIMDLHCGVVEIRGTGRLDGCTPCQGQ